MPRLAHWLQSIKTFTHAEHGSALPIVGLGIFAMLAAAGIAIDMGRVQIAQSRMANALDAAGLAAGAVANTADINVEVTKYFNVNFPALALSTSVQSLTVSANSDNSVLVLDTYGTVSTTFMQIFGIYSVPIGAHTEITRASTGMEIVLVIDNTGSMGDPAGGGVSKMTAAKNAATSLVNILYGSNETLEDFWIGLVPFAQAVNIGTGHPLWIASDTNDWGPAPSAWMGCVEAREAGGRDVTEEVPNPAIPATLFKRMWWQCDDGGSPKRNAWYGNNSNKDDCDYGGSGFGYKTPLSVTRGPNKYCSQEVTRLTKHKSVITSAINSMTPNGNTHIVLGAAWGWRMLSPLWRGQWGGEMAQDQLPLDYNTPLMNKVAIIMTDGDNTISNSSRGAYGYLNENRLGTVNQSAAETQLDNRLLQVCASMKTNNIIVYTIAFGTGISNATKAMMQTCATQPDYYFYSPTGNDLQSAFHLIGDSLANLRISK